MMRGLAEYVMTGRRQAVIAVVLLGLIPLVNLLNPVVVGLIALRRGLQEVVIVFAWAVLPVAAWAAAGDVVPLIMLFGITGLALLLRETESWELTLLAAIAVGISVEGYFRVQPAVIDALMAQLEQYVRSSSSQDLRLEAVSTVMLSVIGAVYMLISVLLLMTARWMQALLFNPGGFRMEFHSLRIKRNVALGLLAVALLSGSGVIVPESWILYFLMPHVFAGIALVHAVVKMRSLPVLLLVTFYILLMLPVAVQLVVLLALADSWFDFRSRLQNSA
ncbi:MAG TPA: hypothetical protein DEF79_09990 [Gammaproteobacteria bacterium]|nr:hypothetical protein [Gammaproteobacteria bacterium]|tara:strand:+ start:859 stop:1689 length:831 start_codon:yes stop_codon:yes gene_type:complete